MLFTSTSDMARKTASLGFGLFGFSWVVLFNGRRKKRTVRHFPYRLDASRTVSRFCGTTRLLTLDSMSMWAESERSSDFRVDRASRLYPVLERRWKTTSASGIQQAFPNLQSKRHMKEEQRPPPNPMLLQIPSSSTWSQLPQTEPGK